MEEGRSFGSYGSKGILQILGRAGLAGSLCSRASSMGASLLSVEFCGGGGEAGFAAPVHVPGEADAVDLDSPPLLLGNEVDDTGVDLPRRSEHQMSVLRQRQ